MRRQACLLKDAINRLAISAQLMPVDDFTFQEFLSLMNRASIREQELSKPSKFSRPKCLDLWRKVGRGEALPESISSGKVLPLEPLSPYIWELKLMVVS